MFFVFFFFDFFFTFELKIKITRHLSTLVVASQQNHVIRKINLYFIQFN